jgi:hypothetical protein
VCLHTHRCLRVYLLYVFVVFLPIGCTADELVPPPSDPLFNATFEEGGYEGQQTCPITNGSQQLDLQGMNQHQLFSSDSACVCVYVCVCVCVCVQRRLFWFFVFFFLFFFVFFLLFFF